MAGLLTGAGDVSLVNSGPTAVATRTFTVPANAAVGDLVLAFVMTGVNGDGRTFTCGTWSKLCDLRYTATTTNVYGGVFYRVLTAGDVGATVTVTLSQGTSRFCIGVFKTTGLDVAAITSGGTLSTNDARASASTTSASFNLGTAPTTTSVLLRFGCLNMSLPTADPWTSVTPPTTMSTAGTSSGFVGGASALTAGWFGQRDLAAGTAVPAGTLTYADPGVTQRTIMHTLLVPSLVRAGTATSQANASGSPASPSRTSASAKAMQALASITRAGVAARASVVSLSGLASLARVGVKAVAAAGAAAQANATLARTGSKTSSAGATGAGLATLTRTGNAQRASTAGNGARAVVSVTGLSMRASARSLGAQVQVTSTGTGKRRGTATSTGVASETVASESVRGGTGSALATATMTVSGDRGITYNPVVTMRGQRFGGAMLEQPYVSGTLKSDRWQIGFPHAD